MTLLYLSRCLTDINLEGQADGGEDGLDGEGSGEEGLGGLEDQEQSGAGAAVEEGVGEEQIGAMSADTPSCFDCGRVFATWQGVNVHSRNCS